MNKLFYIFIFPIIINAQDIAGTYRLTGIYEQRQQISRYETPIYVSDTHSLGLTLPVSTIPNGQPYQWLGWGPYGEDVFQALNINLFITFHPDGSGYMEGFYPIETTDEEECYTELAVFPVMDYFNYNSSLSAGLEIPDSSIIGPLNYQSPFMGETAGILGFAGSVFFPDLPAYPVQPNLCDGMGNCFDLDLSSLDGEFVLGGYPLPGTTGGYVLKGDLPSFLPLEGNNYSNLYLEYFAIDGAISGLGLGDIGGEDEDGDGTDFDRIGSIPFLTATYVDPGCGFNYPIWGDVTLLLESVGLGDCIIEVDIGNMGYLLDPSLAVWGHFMTYNSFMFSLTQDQQYLTDDSDHDYNGIDGRLIMEFSPLCIPMIYNFHGMMEFKEINGSGCYELGDLNGDGLWNIVDIVALANCILANNCSEIGSGCASDLNGDGDDNVLDIIVLFNCMLADNCDGL